MSNTPPTDDLDRSFRNLLWFLNGTALSVEDKLKLAKQFRSFSNHDRITLTACQKQDIMDVRKDLLKDVEKLLDNYDKKETVK